MTFLTIAAIAFLILETLNVIVLYFFPGSTYGNSVGYFTAWEKSKADPEIHNFAKYMVSWVAGTKLIFIVLLIVILLVSDERTLLFSGIGLVFSIASFFWRLFPLIRTMDKEGQVKPAGYSRTLGIMIGVFILVFLAAVLVSAFV